jgi:hypothetical protein
MRQREQANLVNYILRSHTSKKQNLPCKKQETRRNEAKRARKSCELISHMPRNH